MFRSALRPIVTPQSEHLRLVGALALLYGNADFDAPPIERSSMVLGMASHDRGYGTLDNNPVGAMDPAVWNEIARRGFHMRYWDIIADTIAKYHIRRLASHDDSPDRKAMTREFSQAIAAQLTEFNLPGDVFDRLDRITELCDRISFDFCREEPASNTVSIFPRNGEPKEVPVTYRVEAGIVHVTPWPFSVDRYETYLTAYAADGYPDRLEPIVVPCLLERT